MSHFSRGKIAGFIYFFRFPFTFFILEFLGIHFYASSIHGRRKKCMEIEKARNKCGVMSEKPFSLSSFTAFKIIDMNISVQFLHSNEKSRRCASESELIHIGFFFRIETNRTFRWRMRLESCLYVHTMHHHESLLDKWWNEWKLKFQQNEKSWN